MKTKHPTIFALDGSIMVYEDGSMLELYNQITSDEWKEIISETIKYKIFLECVKTIAVPKLNETWEEEDEWFILQLDVAISRMRNIDALLVAAHDQNKIKSEYSKEIEKRSEEMIEYIKQIKEEHRKLIDTRLKEYKVTNL